MEFKRFKRKGLIFNNNSIGLGLELRIGKKIKVFRIERLTKEDKTFDFLIYDGPKTINGSLKKQIVAFLDNKMLIIHFLMENLNFGKKLTDNI